MYEGLNLNSVPAQEVSLQNNRLKSQIQTQDTKTNIFSLIKIYLNFIMFPPLNHHYPCTHYHLLLGGTKDAAQPLYPEGCT